MLKRLLSTPASSTSTYLTKFLRKLEKHLSQGLFCESCEITDHSLRKVKFNTDALLEINKKLPRQYEGKSAFQTTTI